MDCEEDANALLSLSHSFLPPDSTSTAASSSGQLNTWSGQDSASEIGGGFSPVSPPSGYASLSHGMSESSNHPKYFSNRLSTSHNLGRTNIIMGYSRPDRSLLPMAFPGSEQSASHTATPVTSSDFILNAAVHGGDEQMSLYYEQAPSFRNSGNVYGSHHSLAQVNSGGSNFGHDAEHADITQANSSLSTSHSGYSNEHCAMELSTNRTQDSESLVEVMNRSSHASVHSNSGDIVPASTTFFDARGKNADYSKEMSAMYEASCSKSNVGPNHQLCMASERRSVEVNNLVSELDFSVNSREFAALTASTSNTCNNNNQFDYNSIGRSELDSYRFEAMQNRNTYNMNQDQTSVKHSISSSLTTENISAPSRRSAMWEFSEFQMNPQLQQQQQSEELHFNHGQKKMILNEQADSGLKGQDFGMQPQRFESNIKSMNSSGKADNSMDENRQSDAQTSLSTKDGTNWGGRTRAHRKMARLLGQTDYNENSSKSQATDSCTSTSRPVTFPKIQSSTNQTTFREAHKPIDLPVKYHFSQETPRDTGSNDQMLQGNEREAHSLTYSVEHEQGIERDDEINKHQGGMRDFNLPANLGLSAEGHTLSVQRDPSSLLSNPHLLSSPLDLDFPQTLSLDSSHDPVNQDELFNHSIEPQHISQQHLAFADHLNAHNSQELNLESSYLNATSDKDLDLIRKYPDQNQRDLATDNDFDFDEWDSRLTQSYFERPSNLPQDMTMYQKSGPDKVVGNYNSSSKTKERDSFHGGKSITKQNNLSELQRELTKSSTKESIKGIRIPRDINRALEILQDMQEDERAEERRKEELKKQLQNGLHEQKEKLQQQQQQMQNQHVSINSSPKKTFQNKHQIESLSLTVQQFLAEQGNFIDDQSETTVNFLEPPPLSFTETQQQQSALLSESNLQDMSAYSAFPISHQVTEMDPSLMNKREHQQTEGCQNVSSSMDNHILKKLALSTSTKDQGINSSLSSLSIPPMSNSNLVQPSGHDLSFNLSNMSRFSEQMGLPNDSVSKRLSLPVTYPSIDQEHIRHNVAYQSKNGDMVKTQSFQPFRNEPSENGPQDKLNTGKRENNVLASARQNLYTMMIKEQLCDAVLSVSQQNVKVHQVVLCSMSLYLCNLLQKAQAAPQHLTSHIFPIPVTHTVVLVINGDAIKSSSISAFLMFIYLGKTDFTDSNVMDLFILASSLHVSPLKDLCQEYMWKVNISEDQVKIPEVHVMNSLPSYQNQACQVSLSSEVVTEDKCVNTGSLVKSLPAATQTDRSTSGVGGGGQEEWVMLKKTKQKTVSPSKMKYGSTGKCTGSADNSLIYKPGKKGWLSPKRRFKTEQHFAQAKMENLEQDNFINTTTVPTAPTTTVNNAQNNKMACHSFSVTSDPPLTNNLSVAHHSGDNLHSQQTSCISDHEMGAKPETVNSTEVDHSQHLSQGTSPKVILKTQRTTVEIAEEAAAAKSAAHNYGTRFSGRGSNKPCISYSALVHAYDKKRIAPSSREKPSLIKKKDFVKKHTADILSSKLSANNSTPFPESSGNTNDINVAHNAFNSDSFSSGVEEVPSVKGGSMTYFDSSDPQSVRFWKMPVGKPLKKNIAQRAQDNDMSSDSSSHAQLPFTEKSSFTSTDSREDDIGIPIVSTSSSMSSSNISISEGDLTNVSSIIDSLVNTLESEGGETDLQIVLSDIDTELGNTLLPPSIPASSSTPSLVSVSKTSLYNVKEVSPPPPTSTSASLSLSSSPISSSSAIVSSSESVLSNIMKTKSTPQGYRKRLIQLMKSENAEISINDSRAVELASAPVNSKQSDRQNNLGSLDVQSVNNFVTPPSSLVIPDDLNESKSGNGSSHLHADKEKLTEKSMIDKGCVGDISLSSKFEEATHFHKIFKRKRKAKFRKSSGNETETSIIKYRPKKGQGPDPEGGNYVKVRQRRNTANDSDSGSSRPKVRKSAPNDAVSSVLKVRPPPKKRAKMELELLKVASSKLDSHVGESSKKGVEASVKISNKNVKTGDFDFDKSTDLIVSEQKEADVKDVVKPKSVLSDAKKIQLTERKAKKSCGEKLKKITMEIKEKENKKSDKTDVVSEPKPVTKKESSPKIPKEVNPYIQILEEKLKNMDAKVKFFSCNFCQAQFKRAQRTVKHITKFHEITGQDILENVTIGQDRRMQEACDICGYITKDATYKYMHYHKYFKHNVPLPKGWNLCKCQICNKEFHTNFQLKEHIQTHSDNFFFVCQFCGQIFKTRNAFNSHIFHRHSKERKHLCKICQKTFKTWTQLKIHVRSHTGERPFTCTECTYGSTTQGNMRYHLSNKHEMEKAQVEECMKRITSKTPEMSPAALEGLMASILAKTLPDKALKDPEKKNSRRRKEVRESKGRKKGKQSSSKVIKEEKSVKTMTTSSKVTAQVKAFLSDKGCTAASSSSISTPLPSSSQSQENTKDSTCLPMDYPSAFSTPKNTQLSPVKQPVKIAPKDLHPAISQVLSSNKSAVLQSASSSSSSSSLSSSQDQSFLQAGNAFPLNMTGYALVPTQLLPGVSGSSGPVRDSSSDQTSSILLVSPSALFSAGSVVETQDSSGLQIADMTSSQVPVPQVNLFLNEQTGAVTAQQPPVVQYPSGAGLRGFSDGGGTLILNSSKNVSEEGCYISQGPGGPCLVYANSSAFGQQALMPDTSQQGMQPLFISYPSLPGPQIVQGLTELQFVPQAQEGVTAGSGELIPIILPEQMTEPSNLVVNVGEEVEGQQREVVLTMEVSDAPKKEVKMEGASEMNIETSAESQSSVPSSSEKGGEVLQETNSNA